MCGAGREGVSVLTRCDLCKGQSDDALAITDEGYKAKVAGAGLHLDAAEVRPIGKHLQLFRSA